MSTLAVAAAALRTTDPRFPWVQPTEEEAEVADLLAELAELHIESGQRCRGCAEPWPCAGLIHAESLAAQWLFRAAMRVLNRPLPVLTIPRRADRSRQWVDNNGRVA